MPRLPRLSATILSAVALLGGLPAAAHAVQSDNLGLHAVPPPRGTVAIDGRLDDWDLSGQIEVFANYRTRSTYSTKVAAMYDREFFYLAIVWRDPTPLYNLVDADFEPGAGWKSDCVQLRINTDLPVHIDCWYSTPAKRPVVNIQYGSFNDKNPLHQSKIAQPKAMNVIELGAKEAFTLGEDGKSYTQEIAIPWKLITGAGVAWKDGKPISARTAYQAGERFQMGMEFLWGGIDGRTFPIHRYADLVSRPGASREFFWDAVNDWGPVILEPAGGLKLPPPDYSAGTEAYLQKTAGPVKLAYSMPADGFATLVVEDEQGRRVKNLIGMATRAKGAQTDWWDCTDEHGKLVPPGHYRFRGLSHQGIDPVYEATYGSPGVPPWDTGDGTGAWLSDHCAPRAIAVGGKGMVVLGAERGESGYGIIGIDADGRKKWGDRTLSGLNDVAADERYAYVFLASYDVKPTLARLELETGRYAPFATRAGEQLRVPVFAEGEKPEWIANFAVGKDRIAVPIAGERNLVRFFAKDTAAVLGEVPVPKLGCAAYAPDGVLHVWSDGKVVRLVDGKPAACIDKDLPKWAANMTIDAEGRIYLADRDANQVRVYAKDGTHIRDVGRAGGRPRRGKWQPDGLLNPQAVAVDGQGRLWVAEDDESPKRISVWGADGALVKDYIGPTGYGGTGANADPDDLSRVFGSGCEFTLDRAANRAAPTIALGDVGGQLLKAGGREYFMNKGGRLYERSGDALKLVAAMGNPGVKDLGDWKDIPLPEAPKGTHGYASISFIWSDLNDDGKPEADEVVSGSPWSGWKDMKYPVGVSGYFGSYWLDEAFNLYGVAGESWGAIGGREPMVVKTPLKGWTAGGAPIWDVSKQQLLSDQGRVRGCLYLPSKGMVVAGNPLTGIRDDGTVMWTYRDDFSGVHGSHNAFIPDRDDTLIGTLGCIGRIETGLGTVFGMHSNMGRLYLMTTDGLFVASVFQDCRLGSEPWPQTVRKGQPLGGVTMGSEWFGGHLFRAAKTDEVFLIAGFTAYNLIKLSGFETLRSIPGGAIEVTADDLRAVEDGERRRVATATAKPELAIAAVAQPPVIDGKLDDFAKDSFVAWSAGPYRIRAALAADAAKLYLAYQVEGDDNPMVNGGKDVNQLFATGDSVDLQLGADPAADPKRADAAPGDLRLLISVLDQKPVAVLYRWKVAAGEKRPVTFTCPWRSHTVDRVEVLADAQIAIQRHGGGYTVEAAVPLAALGFAPQPGKSYKLDLGAIFSDAKGDNRAARVYWSNKATGLVADVPGEIMATPAMWGTATVK